MTATASPAKDGKDFYSFLCDAIPGLAGQPRDTSLEAMWRRGVATSGEIAEATAEFFGLPRSSADDIRLAQPAFADLSRRYLRDAYAYPFQRDGQTAVAIADPGRVDVMKALSLAIHPSPPLFVVSFDEIATLFEHASDEPTSPAALAFAQADTDGLAESTETLKDMARGAPIVRVIDQLLEKAVELGATDIHFETERDHLRVRFRVDGFLRRDQRLPLNIAPAIISRLKILSGLDIADRRLPQDGRANLRIGSVEADLRVATMPTMFGESAVIRILLRDNRLLDFARIGMGEKDINAFRALLAEPHGLLIVTGPTGSGKTTTLATAVSMLNDPSRKIITIEDPIEYQITGVHQTQVRPSIGLTFASALRSFLRHDPDVIMVGEMRDGETASIGIQAALTGHLVLTTLHTNSAADASIRLSDMGAEPYLIGASLRGVLGQRLVRRLCERCKVHTDAARDQAIELMERRGIEPIETDHFYQAVGCESCGQTGYRGRIAVFEVLVANTEVRSMIRLGNDIDRIVTVARQSGMTLMLEDGLKKCAQGMTTVDEILRATG